MHPIHYGTKRGVAGGGASFGWLPFLSFLASIPHSDAAHLLTMSNSETAPLLPRTSSRVSSTSSQQRRTLSRAGRASEVSADPDLAHNTSAAPMLPAAPVDPAHATDLHRPRWAEHEGEANYWARARYVWREELAECLGTAFIILFGASVECQTTLHFDANKGKAYSFGDYNSCRFAWAAGVAMAIWVSGGISGGHCNPSK